MLRFEHLADRAQAFLVVDGIGRIQLAHLGERVAVHAEPALLAQVGHPALDCLSIAVGQLEQLTFEVRGNQDIHRRRRRLHERALGNVVGAGVDEVGQHAVLVAGA